MVTCLSQYWRQGEEAIFTSIDTAAGAEYIRANLRKSAIDHTISSTFLKSVDVARLRLFALTFTGVPENNLGEYRYSLFRRGETAKQGWNSVDLLVQAIESYLVFTEAGLVALENTLGKRADRRVQGLKCGIRFFGSEVYSVLSIDDVGRRSLEDAVIEAARAKWFTGFLVRRSRDYLPCSKELPPDFPSFVIRNFAGVFTQAFDGDGYLVATNESHVLAKTCAP